ncbi:hypothetical protein JN06_01345 [Bacteroides zoogleoformans]|uniref:Major tail protein n=1 Tax=Bacteroides zoogleoformans TaxID=28119 RepID=A0ABM6T8W4_9BACE|nr:hypothetical protein [Bacteroides zoogleoformans]AVM53312.1 hypothetical protein C4H11_10560 [Bacteroides zoogleoformans]TWJ14412.1 hypothetical protein JN06_01345 [Bacteroides zoogleoformans]
MAAKKRPIAMGVAAIRLATYGDGVPGNDFKDLPLPFKGTVAFNFADPKEVKIETEGTDEPLYVTFVKDATDYIEFSIPTPDNETIKILCGGTINKGGANKDIWEQGTTFPSIVKTFQAETVPHNGSKVVYTIVHGKIMAKLNQAPGAEQPELLLVRVYKQAAIAENGDVKTAFTREVVSIP